MNVSGGNSKEIFELFTNKQGRRPRMLNAGAEGGARSMTGELGN